MATPDLITQDDDLLAAAFEVAGVGVCFVDERGCFLRVNPKFCEMLGYAVEDLIGEHWTIAAPPGIADIAGRFFGALLKNSPNVPSEWEIKRKDGSILAALVTFRTIGRPAGGRIVVITFTDIQARKATENEVQQLNRELERRVVARTIELSDKIMALERAEEQYRNVVNNVAEGIMIVQDARLVFANPRVSQLTGHPFEELYARPFVEFVHPEDREFTLDRYQRRLRGENVPAHYSFRLRHRDGRTVWVDISIVMIEWAGRVATLSFITDITPRKQLEESLRKSLAEREAILQSTLVGITFSVDRWHRWCNRKFAQMLGYEPEELIGQPSSLHFPDEASWAALGAAAYPLLAEGKAYSGEHALRCKDGSIIWCDLYGIGVEPGNPQSGSIWTVLDITERRRAQEDMRLALAKQKELAELKSRFVSMTSHEFRTPLAAIQSSAELLRDYGERLPQSERAELVEIIVVSVRRMTQMLDNVLAIGRAEAEKLDFKPAPVDLRQLCRDIVADTERAADPHAAAIRVDMRGCTDGLLLDEKLMRHILGNLLSNGLKYSPQGGEVLLEVDCGERETVFAVSDHGIGIPADDLPHLFDAFHRARNVGSITGTGLGLAIVQRCVRLHGGEISVRSAVGEGTRFTVALPRR